MSIVAGLGHRDTSLWPKLIIDRGNYGSVQSRGYRPPLEGFVQTALWDAKDEVLG